jgi:protein TonB
MKNMLIDQLNREIEEMLSKGQVRSRGADNNLDELLEIAFELQLPPAPTFREHLRFDLLERAQALAPEPMLLRAPIVKIRTPSVNDIKIPIFKTAAEGSRLIPASFALSCVAHAAVLAVFLVFSFAPARRPSGRYNVALVPSYSYSLPTSSSVSHGGGGGGDRDKVAASYGKPPRFADKQLSQPTVVAHNDNPKLGIEPTVIGPPTVIFRQPSELGDLRSSGIIPSNGTGTGGGIGSGSGGGIGSGRGAGVGPGEGGGIGGGIFRVGGGVSAPRAIYAPDPEYSEEARQAKYQGTVVLWVVIDAEGHPRELRVVRSLGLGLDEKAIAAVRNWRFDPALKDGSPVAVQVNIEVSFRLY